MTSASVMKRLARSAGAAPQPASASAILARAMRRACDRSAGLDVHIADAGARELNFEDAIALVDPSDLLIELTQDGSLAGCVVITGELRAAIVEAQTMGAVNPKKAEPRPSSGADAALCLPVVVQLTDELRPQAVGTQIEGWLDKLELGQRLASTRILELTLTNETMGCIEIVCKIIGTKREARLFYLPPLPEHEPAAPAQDGEDWVKLWRPVAQSVPAKLEAVLHRMVVGVAQVEQFKPGDVVPLTGAKVTDLRLVDGTGAVVTKGRLGQISGFRAIRVEAPPVPEMSELSGATLATGSAGPDLGEAMPALAGMDMPGEFDAGELDMPATAEGGEFDMPEMSAGEPSFGSEMDLPEMPGLDPEAQSETEFEMPEIDLPSADFDMGDMGSTGGEPEGLDLDAELPDLSDLGGGDAGPTEFPDIELPEPPALDLDADIILPDPD